MLIQINKDFRITSDINNLILQERKIIKKTGEDNWVAIAYSNRFSTLAKVLASRRVKSSEATKLSELQKDYDDAIEELLIPLKDITLGYIKSLGGE